MIDQGTFDTYNNRHNILDYDDSDVLTTNHFETHSFKENDNNLEVEINSNFYGQIERLTNEKILIQNHCNSKVVELQSQIMKLTNNFERIETSKTELEVELVKSQKELRQTQRSLQIKSNEFQTLKMEFSNQFKSLESDYVMKISHGNCLNKSLQEQLCEEKRNSKSNQEFLSEKINQLSLKLKEKEEELLKIMSNQSTVQKTTFDIDSKLFQLTKNLEESGETISIHLRQLAERDLHIESLKVSEAELKSLVLDLTSKINFLESKMFEEKHELTESKTYQNHLQTQLMDLQHAQINKDKEYNMLIDKVCNSNKKVKELEEALNNQIQLSSNYNENLRMFENKNKLKNYDIKDQNENLLKKVTQLEETVQIQKRIIDETNEELSTSRQGEGVAVSNLSLTLDELGKLIEDPKIQLRSPMKATNLDKLPKVTSEYFRDMIISSQNNCADQKAGDTNRDQLSNKRIIKNVKQIITDFQEQINRLESDRLEGLDKIQEQDKEIKKLRVQTRKYLAQNKGLEINIIEKQNEIENLIEEVKKLKGNLFNLKSESTKNQTIHKDSIENLKNSILRVSEDSQNNIESRDKYLQNISMVIKEALQNCLLSYSDWSKLPGNQHNVYKTHTDSILNECSTQTHRWDATFKDSLELSGNLTGTFCFNNPTNANDTNTKLLSKGTVRTHENVQERKADNRQNNIPDENRKSLSKKSAKVSDNKKETYVDSAQSWPALREVISNELSALLSKYDIQRAQCRHLMTELSAKEHIITRLLSYQNSNSFNNQATVESTFCEPHKIENETPVNNNKVSLKGTYSNQSNVQIRSGIEKKKNSKSLLKSTGINTKQSTKLDHQRPYSSLPMNQTGKHPPTNRKATTTSIKTPVKFTGNPVTPNSITTEPLKRKMNLSVKKQTTISLPSTQPVILKYPKIVDDEQLLSNVDGVDRGFISLFLGVLVHLIHARSELDASRSLVGFYKLVHHRSVDCSKLISVNDFLDSVINQSAKHSKHLPMKRKIKKIKVVVHAIMACRYMSKRVLSAKLMVNIDTEFNHTDDFIAFFYTLLDSVSNSLNLSLVGKECVESVMNDFVRFCVDHDNRHLLISKPIKNSKNVILTSSNAIVLHKLDENIHSIQTIIQSQISHKYFRSQCRSYQNNIQSLIIKIKDLGQIIDGQNTLLAEREDTIKQLKEKISKGDEEISNLQTSIRKQELLYQRQSKEGAKIKLLISKTKSYLSNIMNTCEKCLSSEIFNYDQLMGEEELIYAHLGSEDSDDFIDFVRDGIRVALRLSCSVKSILI